jgi:hypothetical protein
MDRYLEVCSVNGSILDHRMRDRGRDELRLKDSATRLAEGLRQPLAFGIDWISHGAMLHRCSVGSTGQPYSDVHAGRWSAARLGYRGGAHDTLCCAAQGCQQILVRCRPAAQLGVITDQPPESRVRVAIWVAVHRRSAQFNGVRAHGLSCGANATEPKGPAPLKLFNP